MGELWGYVRVSATDQNPERQLVEMQRHDVPERHVIVDKQSGKDFDRPGWRRLLRKLKPGDTLIVKSIDRLGRDYDEILEQWRYITKTKKAAIVVLDMPLLDTREDRNLIGRVIADIVLQLLSYVAQTEREFIKQRQAEGIAAAKAAGRHLGRKRLPYAQNFPEVMELWERGFCTARGAAKLCGVTHKTFLNQVERWKTEESI